MVLIDAQLCEYSKSLWIVDLRGMNCMVWGLYFNEVIFKTVKKKKNLPPSRVAFCTLPSELNGGTFSVWVGQ